MIKSRAATVRKRRSSLLHLSREHQKDLKVVDVEQRPAASFVKISKVNHKGDDVLCLWRTMEDYIEHACLCSPQRSTEALHSTW